MDKIILTIKNKIEHIKKHDQNFNAFGASDHHYIFNKCLSDSAVRNFEKDHGIILPEDYKEFIIHVGDGGPGPGYGLLSLKESMIDFKLDNKAPIAINLSFPYSESWNEKWIENIDWDNERPDDLLVDAYMDVSHISGSLQISHFGHGCTYLLVVNGKERGNIWFDGRADYSGFFPETIDTKPRVTFIDWYMQWVDSSLAEIKQQAG